MRSALKVAAVGGILSLMTVGPVADLTFGQVAERPRFLAADVHTSAKGQGQGLRPPISRGETYEIRNNTMADLIALAYSSNLSKVVGGPSWLEMDGFDVIAKQPAQTAPEQQKLMLQSLLAERFKLVVREETKPVSSYALTAGAKSKLKEADGSGSAGCTPQSSNTAPGQGTLRIGIPGENGTPVQLTLTDGMIEYKCRNITMAAFADQLRGMLAVNLGANPVVDQTGLTGKWNFDLKYSIGLISLNGPTSNQITIFEAIYKGLGLKLEEKQIPMPVVVVESVNQQPIANPAGTTEALPRNSVPKEFEVASVKVTSPDSKGAAFQMQPGGRLNAQGVPLSFLINRAFNPGYSAQVAGMPGWADATRIDVLAQAPPEFTQALDPDTLAPMMLALLKERFGLTYHTEQRELAAYDLVAGKPKMKKADPSARSWCKSPQQVPGAALPPSGTQALICQNITMSQFAELLRGRSSDLQTPIGDATGLEGGWDFRLTFNPVAGLVIRAAAAPEGTAANPVAAASDPTAGLSIMEAVDKQIGLKLEKVKRTVSVTVIDHIDQMPTEN